MASVTAGEVLGIKAPGSGETVRLPIMLLDTDGVIVTGEAFDAAGMTVEYQKEGESAFSAFPTFDTNNWDEIGHGKYEVIIRESDATELALLDTEGHFSIFVGTTATRGDVFLFKVNPADIARDDQWTDARGAYLDNISAGAVALEGADSDTLETLSNQLDAVAVPGDAMTLTVAERTAVATAIIVFDLAGYEATAKDGTRVGDMLAAVRAGIAGKLVISGTTVTLYEVDGVTAIWTATLDSATTPTSRAAPA